MRSPALTDDLVVGLVLSFLEFGGPYKGVGMVTRSGVFCPSREFLSPDPCPGSFLQQRIREDV